jgi:hypothetical protein
VRFWWAVAAALVLGMGYLLVMETLDWSREVRLVKEGAVVQAVVYEAGQTVKNRPVPPTGNVDLTYTYEGKQYKVTGELAERPAGTLMSASTIPLRVDPGDPRVWTNRTVPPSLWGKMLGPLLLLPAALLAVVVAVVARGRVAKLWRTGEARQAVVVETKQTPLAPLSQAVRCAIVGGDKRLITVYVPQRGGRVKKGDVIWVVAQGARAVAAGAFLRFWGNDLGPMTKSQ